MKSRVTSLLRNKSFASFSKLLYYFQNIININLTHIERINNKNAFQ